MYTYIHVHACLCTPGRSSRAPPPASSARGKAGRAARSCGSRASSDNKHNNNNNDTNTSITLNHTLVIILVI